MFASERSAIDWSVIKLHFCMIKFSEWAQAPDHQQRIQIINPFHEYQIGFRAVFPVLKQ